MKFITQAAKVLNEQKKYKRRLAVFLCLAVVVALGTAAALKMYGQAMSHKQKKLVCRYAAHVHTDECFDGEAVVCGYADYAVHLHNDDCYGPNGELVCHLPEAEAHVHTEECYTEQEVLICEEEEAQAHEHTEGCYTPERGELSCQMEEHMHEDSCYGENGEIICPLEEHQHDDNCYQWKEVLTCTLGAHEHTQDCYTREMRELSCNLEEHEHGEACYDENGELVCQLEEHTHDDDCYVWEDVLTCQLEESDGGHVHGDGCYEMQKVLSCGKLELHTHDDSCYDENGVLTCGLLQLEEHVHGEDCFETVELTEEEVLALNGGGEKTVSEDEAAEESVSGDEVTDKKTVSADETEKEAHEHTEECYDAAGGLICGYENELKKHSHNEDCYDKTGKLLCGYVSEEKKITKICEKDTYIVTATYSENANIPEEAELIAEQITIDSDSKHYAEREAEFQKILEDKNATMGALFKMGFYVDGKEVEPESTVKITVQFLDENGLKKGRPIKVVHFAEKGSEVVQGNATESGNAIFEVSSFSEIAIGNGSGVTEVNEDGTIFISQDFNYDNESVSIAFHMEGEAVPFEDEVIAERAGTDEIENKDDENLTEIEMVADDKASTDTKSSSTEEGDAQVVKSDEEIVNVSNQEDENNESQTAKTTDVSEKTLPANENEEKGLELEVIPLTEKSDEYQTILEHLVGPDNGKKEALIQGVSYSLIYNGVKMDLSDVEVKASITPTEAFKDEMNKLFSNSLSDKDAIYATVIEVSEDAVNELGLIPMNEDSTEWAIQEHQLNSEGENGIIALSGDESSMANPKFTVQYYANLDIISQGTDGKLDVIDTSNGNNGTSGLLPENNSGGTAKSVKIDLETTGIDVEAGGGYKQKAHKVKSKNELREVYAEKEYQYVQSPALAYFNTLIDNNHYKLKEIWILKGEEKNSTNRNDWDVYTKVDGKDSYKIDGKEVKVHFTNREETAKGSTETEKFILITDDDKTVIRLVYDPTPDNETNATKFYDYDISDGKIYDGVGNSKKVLPRGSEKFHEKSPEWYMYTNQQGINSNSNYEGKGAGTKFAFGNSSVNTKTTLGELTWVNGGVTNKPNMTNKGQGFQGCTFGLADHLKEDGTIQYANGIIAPNLFNEEGTAVAGKTEYDGSLTFNRNGDTYTMTTAEVAGEAITGLDLFNNPSKYDGINYSKAIWTNNFWPMDKVSSAGTDTHDLMFGTSAATANTFTFANDLKDGKMGTPLADDFKNHNSYFGMYYTVDFELTNEYVGPLEYLFYGDDDMWVFLSKKRGEDANGNAIYDKGKRICDIGGVHSSVGEYVNLWDWIERDKDDKGDYSSGKKGSYRLSFFYTERGASGSSCWMQFTLPSVSFAQPERTTGILNVEKEIFGGETEDEFEFNIRFTDEGNNCLKDDYVYTKFSKDGTSKNDILVWDNSYFTLKAGEHIKINYLPIGTKYIITELGPVDPNTENHYIPSAGGTGVDNTKGDDPNAEGKPVASGVITSAGENYSVKYTNTLHYELPETGGSGVIAYTIAGVFCIMIGAGFMYTKKFRKGGNKAN